ncbi:MAG: stage III sporulation protein AC [Clostridia bacterium]|nr:stage III sporulation protein AC [Clostridia bacterium]
MDVSLILKIAGIGILISVTCQILNKSGRDDQAMMVSIAGILLVAILLIGEIRDLFELLRATFGF